MYRKINVFFGLLIVLHVFHVIEEIMGKANFIDQIYGGIGIFIGVMGTLLLIPLILFYGIILKKKVAYYSGIGYAAVMAIDGLDHLIRNYPGQYTGALLAVMGIVLIIEIIAELNHMKGGE